MGTTVLERDDLGTYPEVDPDFGNWLAGFIDGEGCFTIRRITYVASQASYSCTLRISLRDDDYSILAEAKERTGLGLIRSHVTTHGSHNPQVQWAVQRKADCLRLVHLLDKYPLRAKKARDFAIWRLAVIETQRTNPGRGKFDWSKVAALKDELIAVRAYKDRR